MSVTESHEERNTLSVDVFLPGHDPRATTPLFERTRKLLIARDRACFISGAPDSRAAPLQAHHHPVERSFAEMIDWQLFSAACQRGEWGPHAQLFDWARFFDGATWEDGPAGRFLKPADPYLFVDDMTVNGMLLAEPFHIGKDQGVHNLPYPVWLAQKLGLEGYRFSSVEIIHHAPPEPDEAVVNTVVGQGPAEQEKKP